MKIIKGILTAGTLFLITACQPAEPPLKPLSDSEIKEYKELKEDFELNKLKAEQYKAEQARLAEISEQYLKENIKLVNFEFFKSNQFDDGRTRACYRGLLVNEGEEILEELGIVIKIRVDDRQQPITWETNLYHANDEFLNNDRIDVETRSAVRVLAGERKALKPGESYNLSKNRSCMRDVFLGWSVDDIEYELNGIKLRPRVEDFPSWKVMNEDFFRMRDLMKRGVHFGQIEPDAEN